MPTVTEGTETSGCAPRQGGTGLRVLVNRDNQTTQSGGQHGTRGRCDHRRRRTVGARAAREVLDAGREPLVLEADERIGGRILTEEVDGVPLELGAQWIGDTHHRMEALADGLGVKIYDQFEDGETTYEFAGGGAARRRLPRQVRCRADRTRTGAP